MFDCTNEDSCKVESPSNRQNVVRKRFWVDGGHEVEHLQDCLDATEILDPDNLPGNNKCADRKDGCADKQKDTLEWILVQEKLVNKIQQHYADIDADCNHTFCIEPHTCTDIMQQRPLASFAGSLLVLCAFSFHISSVAGRSVIVEVCAQRPLLDAVCSDLAIVSIDLPSGVPFPQWGIGSIALPGIGSILPPLAVHGLSTRRVRVAFYDLEGTRVLDIASGDSDSGPELPVLQVATANDSTTTTYSLRLLVIESTYIPFFTVPKGTVCVTDTAGKGELHFAGYRLTQGSILAIFILALLAAAIVWTSLFLWCNSRWHPGKARAS